MISFAAFQSKQTSWDLLALVAIGVLGIFMRRFEWPRPAFLIGFVLADQAEVYTYQATQIAMTKGRIGGAEAVIEYVFSGTLIALLVITVVSVWLGARQSAKLNPDEAGETRQTSRTAPLVFAALVAAFLAGSAPTIVRFAAAPCRAWIHCGNELKSAGKAHAVVRAGDVGLTAFQRLPQQVQHMGFEVR